MRRSLGAVLIVLGVLCVLLAFCLDAAAGKTADGAVTGISHSAVCFFCFRVYFKILFKDSVYA